LAQQALLLQYSSMVKAVQAEDALSEHFDGLLKDRVAAEVGQICCFAWHTVRQYQTSINACWQHLVVTCNIWTTSTGGAADWQA